MKTLSDLATTRQLAGLFEAAAQDGREEADVRSGAAILSEKLTQAADAMERIQQHREKSDDLQIIADVQNLLRQNGLLG